MLTTLDLRGRGLDCALSVFRRQAPPVRTSPSAVSGIIEEVRLRGDEALRRAHSSASIGWCSSSSASTQPSRPGPSATSRRELRAALETAWEQIVAYHGDEASPIPAPFDTRRASGHATSTFPSSEQAATPRAGAPATPPRC